MAKEASNTGTIVKIATLILTAVAMLVAGAFAFKDVDGGVRTNKQAIHGNAEEIVSVKDGLKTYVWPQVEASKKHIATDELNQSYMEKRFDRLESHMSEFSSEQRKVNAEILRKLE